MRVAAIIVTLVGVGSIARADATLPGGATLSFGPLSIHEHGAAELVTPSSADAAMRYFNRAHCACSQPGAAPSGDLEATYAYPLMLTGTTSVHAPVDTWVGTQCDDAARRPAQCHRITSATIADVSTIPASGVVPEVPVFDVMEPESVITGCDFRMVTAEQWAMVDVDGDGVYDYFVGQTIATDALAPPLPSQFRASPGSDYIDLTWTAPSDGSDVAGYQALCATRAGDRASTSSFAARYITARQLCGESYDVPLVPSLIETSIPATVDADLDVEIPQGIAQLDPTLLCGEQTDPTATSMHIGGLASQQELVIELLAVDNAGNPAATYFYPDVTTTVAHTGGCACDAGGADLGGWPHLAIITMWWRRRRKRRCNDAL